MVIENFAFFLFFIFSYLFGSLAKFGGAPINGIDRRAWEFLKILAFKSSMAREQSFVSCCVVFICSFGTNEPKGPAHGAFKSLAPLACELLRGVTRVHLQKLGATKSSVAHELFFI